MPLDAPYEIHALVKQRWKLLVCLSSSQAAIDDAIKLQQNDEYAAVRVVARPLDQTGSAPHRLLYQFTRSGHDVGRPESDRMAVLGAAEPRLKRTDARPHASRRHLKYWIGAALLLILGFEGCA